MVASSTASCWVSLAFLSVQSCRPVHSLVNVSLLHDTLNHRWVPRRLTGVAASLSQEPSSTFFGKNAGEPSGIAPPTEDEPSQKTERRRRRKNKYAAFSKAERLELDPFDQLLAESAEKSRCLEHEAGEKRKRLRLGARELPPPISGDAAVTEAPSSRSLAFPDAKGIDPYDPTTFGYVPIGTIVGPHGVRGWVKVRSDTDFPHRLTEPGIRHLRPARKRAPRAVQLLQGKHCVNDEYLVLLERIETRDEAAALRGAALYAREEDKAPVSKLGNGQQEYLVSELYGLKVFLHESSSMTTCSDSGAPEAIGTVGGVVFGEDVSDVPLGYDMLEIALASSQTRKSNDLVLIPLVPELVPVIDIQNRIVYIDPPSGLLDLTYVREEKVRIKGFLPPAKG